MQDSILYLAVGLVFLFIGIYLGITVGKLMSNREWSKRIPEIRKDATKRSRAVLTGQFCEQLAPYMPGFAYSPTEARFIGKPIDLIVFEGMDKGCIDGLVFIEVKSGNSRLSSIEKELKGAIEEGKVRWEEYRV